MSSNRKSDASNYQSNNKLIDNPENNYADNEGSKSLSSINLKSSTAGSYIKHKKEKLAAQK